MTWRSQTTLELVTLWAMAGLLLAGGYMLLRSLRLLPARFTVSPTGGRSTSVSGRLDGLRTVEEGGSGLDFSASTGWFRPDKYY